MSDRFDLTKEQKRAINLMPCHNVQIIACAGSGKTEIVSRGISEIIKQGGNPSEIVAFTFTEKAAEELKVRIRQTINNEQPTRVDLGDMYVGTIHSYCFEKLKELAPEYRSYDVLDEAARVAYLSKPDNYYKKLKLRRLEAFGKSGKIKKFTVISRFISSVEIALNENVDLKKLKKLNPEFAECLDLYRKYLKIDRYLEFSTMIHELVDLLERDKSALKEMHRTVKYLVVDEYQDINGLQERLIKCMVGPDTKITVVGDDDQSIYEWRGAIVDYIINFKNVFSNVKKVGLDKNFRSTTGIVSLANKYIGKNKKRLPKKMVVPLTDKSKYHSQDIQYQHFLNEKAQAKFIIKRIRELYGSDFRHKSGKNYALSYGDMAILIRTNAEINQFMRYLDEANIPYVVDSGEAIFERQIVVLARGFLEYVFNLNDRKISDLLSDYFQFLKRHRHKTPDKRTMSRELKKIRSHLDQIASKGKKDYLPVLGLQGVFHEIMKAMGMAEIELSEPDYYYLATLSKAISDFEKVWQRLRYAKFKYFNGFIQAWGQHNYSVSANSEIESIDAVKLMTIHKAKGLEFPTVFIPYLNKKRGGRRAISFINESLFDVGRYSGDEDDSRRVYYVALTRSEKYLFLSGMRDDPAVKNPREPARMIDDLDRDYLTKPRNLRLKKSNLPTLSKNTFDFSTSFSDLSAYGRCGYDYKLRYVYGFNTGVPVVFGYGTQIHNILNIIHKKYPDNPPPENDLADLVNRQFFLRYAPGMILKSIKKNALGVIQNYINGHSNEFKNILETEKRFEFPMDDTLITGQIDLIKRTDHSGNLKEIEIVDFKSDSALLYKTDNESQLKLYVLACLRSLGLKPRRACIHDLEKGEKKYVDINKIDLKKTEDEIKKRIQGIKSKKFYPVSKNEICTECDFTKICCHKSLN